MYRFFCPSGDISGDKITILDRAHVHHLKDVLRFEISNEVIVFDDKGNEYCAVIEKLLPQSIELKIKERYKITLPRKTKVTIACAIPKKSKMDDIVDKLTQLGVDRIIPLETERVVARLDKDKKILRQKRWEKIALSAAQQSQRNTLPNIEPIKKIEEVLSEAKDCDLKLIPTLIGERKSLREIFTGTNPQNILVLIGPEGDFTEKEVNLAKRKGFISVSLGDLVLRVETAAVSVASFIRLYENS